VKPGLVVEALTHRLAACPPEFLAEPRVGRGRGTVHVAAVVNDLLQDLGGGERLNPEEERGLENAKPAGRNRLRLVLVGCWLSHDPWIRDAGGYGRLVRRWLVHGLDPLAPLAAADAFVADPDRREEMARLLLQALEVLPAGETPAQAADRLRTLSTVERAGVVRETRVQQERARELKRRMEEQRAQQAAARYSSE
jgi:hypothetical protein